MILDRYPFWIWMDYTGPYSGATDFVYGGGIDWMVTWNGPEF